jgi:hypothetical protein
LVDLRYINYTYLISSLTKGLLGIDAIASLLRAVARDLNANLIEATLAAGVEHYIPKHYTVKI